MAISSGSRRKSLTPAITYHSDCEEPPSCGTRHSHAMSGSGDNWSHGSCDSPPSWTPPVELTVNYARGSTPRHHSTRTQFVSNATANVALDSSENPIVVSANAGATAYSSSGGEVWSTTTPMPVTDVAVDSTTQRTEERGREGEGQGRAFADLLRGTVRAFTDQSRPDGAPAVSPLSGECPAPTADRRYYALG